MWIVIGLIAVIAFLIGVCAGVMIAGSGVLDEIPDGERKKREKNPF
jgi:hypothetical protein